jgi:hypothetical protein
MRWECGVPWLEPGDYPTEDDRGRFAAALEREGLTNAQEASSFIRQSRSTWSRYILALADTVGIVLFPSGHPREDIRSDARPLLWTDGRQPLPEWCRMNDWWVDRGGAGLQLFNATAQEFRTEVIKGGVGYAPLTLMDPGSPGAPMIVR